MTKSHVPPGVRVVHKRIHTFLVCFIFGNCFVSIDALSKRTAETNVFAFHTRFRRLLLFFFSVYHFFHSVFLVPVGSASLRSEATAFVMVVLFLRHCYYWCIKFWLHWKLYFYSIPFRLCVVFSLRSYDTRSTRRIRLICFCMSSTANEQHTARSVHSHFGLLALQLLAPFVCLRSSPFPFDCVWVFFPCAFGACSWCSVKLCVKMYRGLSPVSIQIAFSSSVCSLGPPINLCQYFNAPFLCREWTDNELVRYIFKFDLREIRSHSLHSTFAAHFDLDIFAISFRSLNLFARCFSLIQSSIRGKNLFSAVRINRIQNTFCRLSSRVRFVAKGKMHACAGRSAGYCSTNATGTQKKPAAKRIWWCVARAPRVCWIIS